MDYKTKYLKYKTKYLKLKSHIGGAPIKYTYEYMDDLYNFIANLEIFKDMHIISFNTSSFVGLYNENYKDEIYYTIRLIYFKSKYNNSTDDQIYQLCNDKTQYTIGDLTEEYLGKSFLELTKDNNNDTITKTDYINLTCDLDKNEIKKPIPGNSKKCTNDIPKGTNFMWGNWVLTGLANDGLD